MKRYNIAVIGVGGFARHHLTALSECESRGWCTLRAVVIRPEDAPNEREIAGRLAARGVTIYPTADALFDGEQSRVDLVVIPVGIDQHEPLSVKALRRGFHVFCEKPAAGTVDAALRMQQAQRESGRTLAVGFQNLFSPSINRIKQIRLEGSLGALVEMRSMILWPRGPEYYARNGWAGRLRVDGTVILDSPIQNAVSHFLQNMLYVAGESPLECMSPREVYAENYRAKPIESADTQFIRVRGTAGSASGSPATDAAPGRGGVTASLIVTHACDEQVEPLSVFIFEKGRITWELERRGRSQVAERHGDDWMPGEVFDNGPDDLGVVKYRALFDALDAGRRPHSTIDNALAHTRCVQAAFSNADHEIDASRIVTIDARYQTAAASGVVADIAPLMTAMYDAGRSFFESGAAWARRGVTVSV